jgi:hypothetical protein
MRRLWLLLLAAEAMAQTLDDFSSAMYPPVSPVYPCTKLLNRGGVIGCESPSPHVIGALKLINSTEELRNFSRAAGSSAVVLVLPFKVFADVGAFTLIDTVDERRPAGLGVLVLAPDAADLPTSFSPGAQNPQQAMGLHPDAFHAWNPHGTGLSQRFFRYPVFMVGRSATAAVLEKCEHNTATNQDYPRWAAKMILTMQAQNNSLQCLRDNTCQPITAQSVHATISPSAQPQTGERPPKIVLAAGVIDSTSFFHGDWGSRADQLSPGGGAEIAGATAIVVAARAVRAFQQSASGRKLKSSVVFALFSAESWGRVGSRRFMASPPAGLNVSNIQYAIGVGGISAATAGNNALYLHTDTKLQPTATSKMNSAKWLEMAGLKQPGSGGDRPGPGWMPPNPVETIVASANRSGLATISAVIAGHDSTFSNPYYHSQLDGRRNAPVDTVCHLASALAKSILVLGGVPQSEATKVADTTCQTFAREILDCTLSNFSCQLASMSLASRGEHTIDGYPPHYVLIRSQPRSRSPLESFFHDLLANETAKNRMGPCTKQGDCSDISTCVLGRCVESSAGFHDAYSPALAYDSGRWTVDIDLAERENDPLWCESNWHSDLGVTMFIQDDPAAERRMLYAGFAVLALSVALVASDAIPCVP